MAKSKTYSNKGKDSHIAIPAIPKHLQIGADKELIIKRYPFNNYFDIFRNNFRLYCDAQNIPYKPDSIRSQIDFSNLAGSLMILLQSHSAANELLAHDGKTMLRDQLGSFRNPFNDFYIERTKSLMNAVLNNQSDIDIWGEVYRILIVSTPPPISISPSVQDTPSKFTTSGITNANEFRKNIDEVLKDELGSIYIGVPNFYNAFFGKIEYLEEATLFVFEKCIEDDNILYNKDSGWCHWPEIPTEDPVVEWFSNIVRKFKSFLDLKKHIFSQPARELVSFPHIPLKGSIAKRKLDIGIGIHDSKGANRWSQVLIPGELKANSAVDSNKNTWYDLGRYAKEVFTAQHTRRFVLGFTLCGSIMRLWEFDRLGGIASESFDINKDGRKFVSIILGYLMMNEEQLGFDPTIQKLNGKLCIDIHKGQTTERLIIIEPIIWPRCIAGRATTCWKAHREQDDQTLLVIKDSWQFTEREEEGKLLSEVPENANVAQYYYHETVRIQNKDDDIQNNVRCQLDITKATNYEKITSKPSTNISKSNSRQDSGSSGSRDKKRPTSLPDTLLPASKRSKDENSTFPNRVHRRVIVRSYGKPIYKASSLVSLLKALEQCIQGHQSLYEAQILHRDISINNLLINEDNNQVHGFLIDLDLAIKLTREKSSGAQSKTGTKIFMAIGLLMGEPHSFMHDLESFFWVLFWICIHYHKPTENIVKTSKENVINKFENWNYMDIDHLAGLKWVTVADEARFRIIASEHFSSYYQPLIPYVNNLRDVVFPNDKPWKKEDERLYSQMIKILQDAQQELLK